MFIRLYNRIRLFKLKNKEPYFSLYQILGFYPTNIELYEQAIHHRSSSLETGKGYWKNNERLEFLGDAILGAVIADIVYKHFPKKNEGFLTNTRSKIVQRESLNRLAIQIQLDKLIIYSAKSSSHNNYMFGNALEAVIGAVYLDKGYPTCYKFIKEKLLDKYVNIDATARREVNFKSQLIEWSQKNRLQITFELIESYTDENGNPLFQTSVSLEGTQLGIGVGYTKKESQQSAAKMAGKRIRKDKEIIALVNELKTKANDPAASDDQPFEPNGESEDSAPDLPPEILPSDSSQSTTDK